VNASCGDIYQGRHGGCVSGKWVRVHGMRNATFTVGNVYTLPCGTSTFDAVVAHAVIGRLPEPVQTLRTRHQVLKPHEEGRRYVYLPAHFLGFSHY
jgi:hypothetical protein